MKKIFYFLAITAAISFAACADKTTEVIDEVTPEQGIVIERDVEPLTLFNDKDVKPEEASVAGTRIVYQESEPGDPNYPGLEARWQYKQWNPNKIQDKAEFFIQNTGSTSSSRVIGRIINLTSPRNPKPNVSVFMTVIDGRDVNLDSQLFYCSVTGSGMAGNRPSDQILDDSGIVPIRVTSGWGGTVIYDAQYFDKDNYPLITTNHVTTDKIMNLTSNYETHLKKSIIQVVGGTVPSGRYIFMQFRPIVMLINLELTNGTNAPINVSKIELASATQWAYDMNHNNTRYNPKLKTTSGNKVSAYKIFENTSTPHQVAANGVLNSYQVAIPAVASISDFQMRITINGTVQTIDLSGAKTLAAEKRIKIKRTWNGTGFVK